MTVNMHPTWNEAADPHSRLSDVQTAHRQQEWDTVVQILESDLAYQSSDMWHVLKKA